MARKAFSHGISNSTIRTRLLTRGANSLEDAISYVIEAENDLINVIPKNEIFCNFCRNTGHRERDCRRKNNASSGVNRLVTALQNLNTGNHQSNNRNFNQSDNRKNHFDNQSNNRSNNNNNNFNNDRSYRDNQFNSNNNQNSRNDQFNRNNQRNTNNNQSFNRNQNSNNNQNQNQNRGQSNNWNTNQNRQISSLHQIYPLNHPEETQIENNRPTFRNASETINQNIEQNDINWNQAARFQSGN